MSEDFVEGGKTDENVNHRHEAGWQPVADAIAECLKTPVQTSDDEQDKRNLMHFFGY
ncbi:MAG: hypothetical protein UY47_C0004G0026 [Parcubacteria group bacterium GW2011_GWB1_49_7]|nr:MAG: hypothetical protein UX71_C0002G0086 [Parcubacteria group bacterium GW2011_GWA1_47_10]KKW09852.1 MAG: hypothetical protein UY47_C0004G0026 [Parcubacteria group bacterium GW2011_GWB1_49_7]